MERDQTQRYRRNSDRYTQGERERGRERESVCVFDKVQRERDKKYLERKYR